ncbi:MAG TPA: DUF6029 family protein [Saprospiraceae bacterium]|nr:DUF6029 family protein [Saprospiraceae bacterium]
MKLKYIIIPIVLQFACQVFAQSNKSAPQISGSLEANGNFFIRDTLIGAANTPQYDRQLYGADAWLNLAYSNWGFDFILRFDLFNNSNLLNPTGSYTDEGIGRWYIHKKIHQLSIGAGYIYDQIGSGIIFRAYEERPLLIDNALYGLRLAYDLAPDWQVRVFTGRQKQQFDTYNSVIKGLNLEGFVALGDTTAGVALAPGFGVLNRTLDDASMNSLVATLNTYPLADIFIPKYNTYAFSLYNTLSAGPFAWYVEGAYKTPDPINDPFGVLVRDSVAIIGDKFIQKSGSVLYSSLSYARSGLGLTLEAKRTENFTYRARPQAQLNQGFINFLPPMARVNTYRLPARYNAATQELGELAFQADARYLFSKNWSVNINFSNINSLDKVLLYRELYAEFGYKYKREWSLLGGVQLQNYNQQVYEFKPGVPNVQTVTPFAEFLYRFNRTRALRVEAQAMFTGQDQAVQLRQDYGSWLFGLTEFSIAPHWTFTASDMYNVAPGRNSPENSAGEKLNVHYPRFDVYYTYRSNRFSLSYVKQVEGVVCAGGICRLEPAFSGVKMSVNSTF